MTNQIRRNWRMMVFVVILVAFFWVIWMLRTVLLPFFVGLVFAEILRPPIVWLERRLPGNGRWQSAKRIIIILLVFLIALGLIGLLTYYIISAIAGSFTALVNNASTYVQSALLQIQDWVVRTEKGLPPNVQTQIDQSIAQLSDTLGNAFKGIFATGISAIPGTIGVVLGFASLPLFLFYVLKDWEKLRDTLYNSLPPNIVPHLHNIFKILNDVLGRYLRAQVVLAFVVGLMVFIGLEILGIPFALVLAIFAGVTEVVPTVGPWLGGITGVVITLATVPDKVIWVALVYIFVQLSENTLLVPRIHGGYLRVHPVFVLVLIVVGTYLAGFWGLVLAVPLAATIGQLIEYVMKVTVGKERPPETD